MRLTGTGWDLDGVIPRRAPAMNAFAILPPRRSRAFQSFRPDALASKHCPTLTVEVPPAGDASACSRPS